MSKIKYVKLLSTAYFINGYNNLCGECYTLEDTIL